MGTTHWEILSDSEIAIFEEIADRHAADREGDLDDMALEYVETAPPVETHLEAVAS